MEKISNLFKSHINKINRIITSQGRDIENGLRLDRNERVSPFGSKDLKAIRDLITSNVLNSYPDTESLYEKIANSFNLKKEQIYLSNGVTESMKNIFEHFTQHGDKVVYPNPTFPMYDIYNKIYNLHGIKINYNGLSFNYKKLINEIDETKKIIFLPNPNLPVEYYYDLDEINYIVDKCSKKNVLCVIDEAYSYFGNRSAIKLINRYSNLLVMQSFSKAYGLAGLRIGVTFGNANVISYLKKSMSIVDINSVAMVIAKYFLDHPEIIKSYTKEVSIGAKYLKNSLNKMGIAFHGGNYTNAILILLDTDSKVDEIVKGLNRQKIYVRGGLQKPFGNCLRVTLGPKDEMIRFIEVFATLL